MKRLLLNCDQVFDVLTRGPFPTGEPEDEAVEQHLRACHDCRQLAEALRPAVALLHEVVGNEEAIDLPEYQGSLPTEREQPRRLSIARLAGEPRGHQQPTVRLRAATGERRQPQTLSGARFLAASLLIAGLGLVFGERLFSTGKQSPPSHGLEKLADGIPSEKGLVTLASLKLPVACLSLTHRPLSTEHAAQIAAAVSRGSLEALHCCTECHHAGAAQPRIAMTATLSQQTCQLCHRG